MPTFFFPFAGSEEGERNYLRLVAAFANNPYPLAAPAPRLYQITFIDRGQPCVATVGEELQGWRRRDRVGPVLAIIDTTGLVYICTTLRDGLSDLPLLVSPGEVAARVYFEDFLAGDSKRTR